MTLFRQFLDNPDSRIVFQEQDTTRLLRDYADSSSGMLTGDRERFYKLFWETATLQPSWEYLQSSVSESMPYGGRSHIVYWERGQGELCRLAQSLRHLNHAVQNWRRGQELWGRAGVVIRTMGNLPCSLYTGDRFDNNTAVVCPRDPNNVPAIWAFCSSPAFREEVRHFNQKINVDVGYLESVPFDLAYWREVAEEKGPPPEPYSNDPTQWLFKGSPADSSDPLQVAVARLLGYGWPEQEGDHLARLADEDGIVPLVPVLDEEPAGERLRALLAAAFGDAWSTDKQAALLSQVGYGGKHLSTWLRDGFFLQHAKFFHNRPFIWHIWDGAREGGFSALVNYHKLDTSALERLIYTYLGVWIDRQRGERDADVAGAEGRLVAALNLQGKLIAIREGEPPYDIYVRWKPKHEQPIGWAPDLNDGVRLNIRPFVEAGVLRNKFTVNWNKDRGTNPDGTERLNDLHLTLAEKRAARAKAGVA